jgi:hypothetical protein
MGTDFEDFIDLFFPLRFRHDGCRCVRQNLTGVAVAALHDDQIIHLVVGSQPDGRRERKPCPDSRFQGLIRLS